MLNNNIVALVITFLVALIWIRLNDFLAHRGLVDSHLSRKLIHIGTGPLYVLCWLLFNDHPINKYLVAIVPLMFTLQFFLIGIGVIKDEASVKAMSRSGNRREILRGPLYYGIIFVLLTLIYWKNSPIGIIALMLMCGGDGLADIFGRKWGKDKVIWNKGKSWAGSLGMLIGGWVLSILITWIYTLMGTLTAPWQYYLLPISVIAFVATLIESLPFKDIDNITITLSALLLGHIFFT
jgi:phytol kinase